MFWGLDHRVQALLQVADLGVEHLGLRAPGSSSLLVEGFRALGLAPFQPFEAPGIGIRSIRLKA